MSPKAITSYADLVRLVGQDLGPSDWMKIDQDRVDLFGRSVEDLQWIHCDPERAERDSPYDGTIVHGMLLLSLLGHLRSWIDTVVIDIPARMNLFYGMEGVRFISPVRVGAKVRLRLKISEARLVDDKVIHVTYAHHLEIENQSKPALVAQAINRLYLL